MNHVIGKVRCPQAHRSNAVCAPMARRATDLVRHVLRGPSLQAKLTVGPANDRYEQEADRVAEQVMSMPAGHEGMGPAPSNDTPGIRRMCAGCEEEVRRQPVEEEEELRTKRSQGSAPAMGANFQARVSALRGQGQPLPASTRAFFEPRFGHRFDQVRVHKDGTAAALAESLRARAFTFGDHIAFASNAYQPDTGRGKKLLAHELTHVVQQSGGRQAVIQRAGPEDPEASEEGFRRAPPRVPLGEGFTKTDCKTDVNDVFFLSSLFVDGARPECSFAQIMELPDLTNGEQYRAAYSLEGKPKCKSGDEYNEFWLRKDDSEWKIVKINASNSVTVVNPCGEAQVLYKRGARRSPQAGEGAAAADPLPKNLVENPRGAKGTVCALRYDDNCDNVWFVAKGSAPADSTFCDPPEKWQWDAEKAAFVAEIIGAGGETEIGTKHPDMLQRFAGIVLKTQLETGEWTGKDCGTVPREFQRPGD